MALREIKDYPVQSLAQAAALDLEWLGKHVFEGFPLWSPTDKTGGSTGLSINSYVIWQPTGGTIWISDGVTRDKSAWYHVVFTCDVDNNQLKGYVNGIEAGSPITVTTSCQFNGDMVFHFGDRNTAGL